MLKTPITVFLPRDGGIGQVPLVTYGKQFEKTKSGKLRKPVKLLYSNGNQCVSRRRFRRACSALTRASARSYDLLL